MNHDTAPKIEAYVERMTDEEIAQAIGACGLRADQLTEDQQREVERFHMVEAMPFGD